ncbi:outer membrane beta-barrel protein [Cyclobacterium sp. 1_MG-2023]|uniref:outer membrane beta-barrel protein n=1 Tax=Cyclobacterium sp. 1_MG-2023 TaxID=3062681 RepID=UPI0026E18AA7|nr:outer membrane beta-barrel protein [Cyclobacterium sp. 1_MG-2023]MDO6437677.1 outer membrane beta-barrel protein [Cyclobacterium sp. 1_MG-2023]
MKEQFDKKLAEKIEASFSNHEEPFDPKQWEKFSDAYFKPKKKAWMIYWPFVTAGVAASLLFFFLYFPKQEEIGQKVKSITDAVVKEKLPSFGKEEQNTVSGNNIGSSAEVDTEEGHNGSYRSKTSGLKAEQNINIDRDQVPIVPNQEESIIPSIIEDFTYTWDEFQAAIEASFDTLQSSTALDLRSNQAMSVAEAQSLVDQWKSPSSEEQSKEVVSPERTFKLGLMVSPQANSNPVSGMNLGAGIMSEISLSKKLKLDVGLAYANQRMGAQANQGMREMLAVPDGNYQKTNSNIIDTEYRLNFASLDIPINLKYKFYDKEQTGMYFITGLSSMVYLDQNTVESYQAQSLFNANSVNGALEYAPSVQSFSNVYTPESGQSNADFAGLLNLSFGYEYKLNKGFYVSFEPFYKLPLGSLTFANQQFSIGGVNLRMNFNFKNK